MKRLSKINFFFDMNKYIDKSKKPAGKTKKRL